MAILACCLYYFQFTTLFHGSGGLSDTASLLMFTAGFLMYLRKSWWVLLIMLMAILQREIIHFGFGAIAFSDLVLKKSNRKDVYFISVFSNIYL